MRIRQEKICEEKVPETLWFHGSQYDNIKELKINPPSPEKIFFVAKKLEYAQYYADLNKNKQKENSSIYICSLKDRRNGLNIFDLSDESGRKTKKEFGNYCVLESLKFAGTHLKNSQDIFQNIIAFISDYCKPIIECNYNKEELKKKATFKEMKDWRIDAILEELPNFLDKVKLTEKDILNRNNVENGIVIRESYCRFWKEIGLNAFSTFETQPSGSSNCLGIFDVSALDMMWLISIPYNVIEKYQSTKQLSNDKAIKEFLKNYTLNK